MALRSGENLSGLLLHAEGQPSGYWAHLGRFERHVGDAVGRFDFEHIARLELVGRHVHCLAFHLEVAVRDQLPRLLARSAQAESIYDVVKAKLEVTEQVDAGHAGFALRAAAVVSGLPFLQPVRTASLLLGAELETVVRRLALAGLAVHARRESAALDGALRRVAALTLEVELGALPPAKAANGSAVVRHQTRLRLGGRQPLCGIGVTSVIALTSKPVACSERIAASRPAPGPRTNTSIERMPCSSAFLAVASAVTWAASGDDVFPLAAAGANNFFSFCHYFPAFTFFLPATARFGPRRPRAFVRVRWPRTGRPRRWRPPR